MVGVYFHEPVLSLSAASFFLLYIWKSNEPQLEDITKFPTRHRETRMTFHTNEPSTHLSLLLYTFHDWIHCLIDSETETHTAPQHAFLRRVSSRTAAYITGCL